MIDYLEIKDQAHQMYAEGTASHYPTFSKIRKAVSARGYTTTSDINITYDNLQKTGRFTAGIIKL